MAGLIRKLDDLGRFMLPIEVRREFNLKAHDAIEIDTKDDLIILKKYKRSCVFCNGSDDLIEYRGNTICRHCMNELQGKE